MDTGDFSRQEAVHTETDKPVFGEQMFAGTCWDGGTQRTLFSRPHPLKALRDRQTLSQPFLTRQGTLQQCPHPSARPGLSSSLERLIPGISDPQSGEGTSQGPAPHSLCQQV